MRELFRSVEQPDISRRLILLCEVIRGNCPTIRAIRQEIARISQTLSTVLITGESGTGKEVVARAIHSIGPRRSQPFVPINCGAIPDNLLESQLFGHVRGSFTGALQDHPGLFLVAHSGTLFLDEIGDLPLLLQVKLLRTIEEKEVWPVGGTKPVRVDVRIIASTNRDLFQEVERGVFREDLFYRLNVVYMNLPPLRERRTDIPLLVDHLIQKLNLRLHTCFAGVDSEALEVLLNHSWRGNVRELENVLERAMLLGDGDMITRRHLPQNLLVQRNGDHGIENLRRAVERFERQYVRDMVELAQFDKRKAAKVLGISLASLYRKLNHNGRKSPSHP